MPKNKNKRKRGLGRGLSALMEDVRIDDVIEKPVSYTHLTLPTILLV